MTIRADCTVYACNPPPFTYKSSYPLIVTGGMRREPAFGQTYFPHPPLLWLPTSKIKQTFLSTKKIKKKERSCLSSGTMATLFPGSPNQGDLGHSNQHRTLMGSLCCRVAHWSGQGLVRSSSQSAALPAQSCSGPLRLTGIIISTHTHPPISPAPSISASAPRKTQLTCLMTLKVTVMPSFYAQT